MCEPRRPTDSTAGVTPPVVMTQVWQLVAQFAGCTDAWLASIGRARRVAPSLTGATLWVRGGLPTPAPTLSPTTAPTTTWRAALREAAPPLVTTMRRALPAGATQPALVTWIAASTTPMPACPRAHGCPVARAVATSHRRAVRSSIHRLCQSPGAVTATAMSSATTTLPIITRTADAARTTNGSVQQAASATRSAGMRERRLRR